MSLGLLGPGFTLGRLGYLALLALLGVPGGHLLFKGLALGLLAAAGGHDRADLRRASASLVGGGNALLILLLAGRGRG